MYETPRHRRSRRGCHSFTHFIVTASRDGQIKFWKKQQVGIEFVKHYRAHSAPITSTASPDMRRYDGGGHDQVFDVLAFDMINWIVEYTPGACEFISGRVPHARCLHATSEDAQVHA